MNRTHLLLFSAGYSLLFWFLFEGYRYVFDPDATGYLSVAEMLAKGSIHDSINGIWSPLNSWILVPFLNYGFDGILSQKYLNGIYGLLSLIAFFYFIKKMQIDLIHELAIMIPAVLLTLYFAFCRMFGDLLQLLFLLLYLNVICADNFGKNYRSIILAAIIGGIGFYAKAYIFYFTLLHLCIAIYLAELKFFEKISPKRILEKTVTAISILCFVASFWIVALRAKYGNFILGEKQITGTLSAQYNQPRVIVYPPPHTDSYSIFDDISFFERTPLTPFTDTGLLIAQCKLIIYNFLRWVECLNKFSFAVIFIIIISLFLFLYSKEMNSKTKIGLLLSFIIAWSSGFLLFHVEPRFLWIITFCVLALAGIILSKMRKNYNIRYKYLYTIIIIGSFCIYPLIYMQALHGQGKNNFEIAEALEKNGITGKILTSNQSSEEFSKSIIINYLSKCKHYGPFVTDYTTEEILQAINKYQINYFILYYSTLFQKQLLLTGDLALKADIIYENIYPGIIVLSFAK